ncbi:MAG: quinoprotein dehydrogenase-associated putative ABC transporter substrate-binding protein [Dokdonella sp.]
MLRFTRGTPEFPVRPIPLLLIIPSLLVASSAFAAAEPIVSETPPLRVCADPGNMPLSNKSGEGFQNKIAEILAKGIGARLEYYWYPYYGRGLARSTINADHCDVLMDVPSDYEQALVTKPYYKSTFVLAYRHDRDHPINSLDDPILQKWKIGVLQSSPARVALREHNILENTEVKYVFYDSTFNPNDHPGKQVEDVVGGKLDAVETWGPIAGYYAKMQKAPIDIVPLNMLDDSVPLEFSMSFGVRRADKALKARLDKAFADNKDAIRAVLDSYGVPLLKCADCIVSGDLVAHGPYSNLEAANVEARKDHPESSASELEATKKRILEGASPTKELADAVVGNDPARVRWLLGHKANIDEVAQLDFNALQWAVREGHVEIARILLEHRANVEFADKDGWTPLMSAVYRNNPDMAELLIDKGAKASAYNAKGMSPLYIAITYGDFDMVETLVAKGVDVNAINQAGYTPIMFATAKSQEGVLDLLIKKGANVRAANKAGITSLMLAAAENNDSRVKRLLAAGADPAAKDSKGQNALDIARVKGNTGIVEILSKNS